MQDSIFFRQISLSVGLFSPIEQQQSNLVGERDLVVVLACGEQGSLKPL